MMHSKQEGLELPLVKWELHHEAGKEKYGIRFRTFPSRFLSHCAGIRNGWAEAGWEGSLFDKEPVDLGRGNGSGAASRCLFVSVLLGQKDPTKILFSCHSTQLNIYTQAHTIAGNGFGCRKNHKDLKERLWKPHERRGKKEKVVPQRKHATMGTARDDI